MRVSPSFFVAHAHVVVPALVVAACSPPDVCPPTGLPVPRATRPGPRNGFLARAHAHNDYEQARPLQDALDHGFASVEADVWHRDGAIVVSHAPFSSRGTLQDLYLDPLAARVAERRSVHGDGAAFTLWLDLKDDTPELRALLREALDASPFLRRFDDGEALDLDAVGSEDGAVAVIVTGGAASKRALLDETDAPRPFVIDSNELPDDGADPDPSVAAYALSFGRWLGAWDGAPNDDGGAVPEDVFARGTCVVARAHRGTAQAPVRRPVRLFGAPDTPAAWDFVLDLGVDFVNTDDLAGLHGFLRERVAP